IILRKENVSLLKESAVTVWIHASIDASVKRLDSSRPLLNVEDPVQRAMELFSERKKLYAIACDLLVSNENKTAEKCAEIIYEEIR
ncbi:MAG TPA: shikimate kinase, partial [Spirochaetota bacterium]|nr:shikimate kinase [Spirochaetota bacterium]